MAWTVPKTWAAGALTAAELNEQIRDNETWLKAALALHGIISDSVVQPLISARYGVSLARDSSVGDTADHAVNYSDAEVWDDAAFHSTSVNPTRVTIPVDGTYDLDAWVNFEANATGRRESWFEVNGVTQHARTRLPSSGSVAGTNFCISKKVELSAGDYIEHYIRQTSGGSLDYSATFQVHCIAR